MVADVRINMNDAAVRAALERLRLNLPAQGDMTPVMNSIGRVLKTATQLRFRSGKAPDGSAWKMGRREGGQTLNVTRRLRNSITYHATRDSVEIGTNVAYAAIHQFGGIIRAKKGPFLAIPITPQARSAGSPRNMQNLVFAQSLKGQFMLLDSETGTVHFLLRKSVVVPARPFIGVSDTDRDELLRTLEEHLQGTWGGE